MNILTSISVFVIITTLRKVSLYTQTCIQEYCFTTPDANQLADFNGAKSWCTTNGSTLAVINDSDAQQALTQFLQSSNINSMTFINVKLYQNGGTWYLINGDNYNGRVGNQDRRSIEYTLYCCLKLYWDHYQVDASNPNEMNRYICEFQDNRCLNNLTGAVLYNGRCYVKYEKVQLTWYQARERCVDDGGDLATFQSETYSLTPQFNTSWLNPSFIYWVGIRWSDWRWITPDDGTGTDTIYTSWSSGEPNNYDNQCVCVDPTGNPAWSWTDCDCDKTRQFVCLRIVPTTTTSTAVTKVSTISTTKEVIALSNLNSTANALAIGLGAGLGGGLFVIVLIVLIIAIVVVMRKRRRKNSGVEIRHKDDNPRIATTPNTEHEASDTSEFYAHVVPTTQHPANTKAQNDVIYAKPEFPNSTPSGPDPNSILQGRVQSIMLEGPNDFYANAASVS